MRLVTLSFDETSSSSAPAAGSPVALSTVPRTVWACAMVGNSASVMTQIAHRHAQCCVNETQRGGRDWIGGVTEIKIRLCFILIQRRVRTYACTPWSGSKAFDICRRLLDSQSWHTGGCRTSAWGGRTPCYSSAGFAHFFDKFAPSDVEWLDQHAITLIGMVEADATEVHLAGYLRAQGKNIGLEREPMGARAVAISVWHIAKAALVRDFAERVLRGEVPINEPTPEKFEKWMAERLLSVDEMKAFEETAVNPYHD